MEGDGVDVADPASDVGSGYETDEEEEVEAWAGQLTADDRKEFPELPRTVTCLETPHGCKVYVVGTAHFSLESQEDVAKTISETVPDTVMLELCHSRTSILELDEATIMREVERMDTSKIIATIQQEGVVQGTLHLMLLSLSAHITRKLGMAPGGEFRRAHTEARKVRGCRVVLGDRPIQVTLKRALGSMSVWQKMRMAWYVLTSDEPISKEDVEKCKESDLLEEMLREMAGEYPQLSQVFVQERDVFLAHSLRLAASPLPVVHPETKETTYRPSVVVGVVGIGHVSGIVQHWDQDIDVSPLMTVPQETIWGKSLRVGLKLGVLAALGYGGYRATRFGYRLLVR